MSLQNPFTFPLKVRNLLRLLDAGIYPSKIARILKMSRQHVHYYVKRLQKLGYIKRDIKGAATFYSLTQLGIRFLTRSEVGGSRVFRLHNFCVKYPLLGWPRVPVDWGRVQGMRNWGKRVGSVLGLTVEVTTRSLLIYSGSVEGDNPYELVYRAWRECDRLAEHLESLWKMRLGHPRLKDEQLHFAVYDPVAEEAAKDFRLTIDVAEIDRSHRSRGEIDWFGPENAMDYLLMPARLKRIESLLNAILSDLEKHKKTKE